MLWGFCLPVLEIIAQEAQLELALGLIIFVLKQLVRVQKLPGLNLVRAGQSPHAAKGSHATPWIQTHKLEYHLCKPTAAAALTCQAQPLKPACEAATDRAFSLLTWASSY